MTWSIDSLPSDCGQISPAGVSVIVDWFHEFELWPEGHPQ